MTFLLGNWKLIAIGLAFTFMASLGAAAFVGAKNLFAEVSMLRTNNELLTTSMEIQRQTINSVQQNTDAWVESQNYLLETIQQTRNVAEEANRETRRLNDLFAKHNLEQLALARPGLVETRINRSTRTTLRLFECATSFRSDDCPTGVDQAGQDPTNTQPNSSPPG